MKRCCDGVVRRGMSLVIYFVHFGTRPMAEFNRKLGAETMPDPKDRNYMACAIRL